MRPKKSFRKIEFAHCIRWNVFDENASIRNKCVHSTHKLNVVVQGLGVYLPAAWLKTHPGNHTNRLHKSFSFDATTAAATRYIMGQFILLHYPSCAWLLQMHRIIRQICMTCLVVSHLGETMICLLKTQLWLSQWAKNGKKCIIIRSTHMCQGGMTWHYIRLLIIAE